MASTKGCGPMRGTSMEHQIPKKPASSGKGGKKNGSGGDKAKSGKMGY